MNTGKVIVRLELICLLLWSRFDFKIGGGEGIMVVSDLVNIY